MTEEESKSKILRPSIIQSIISGSVYSKIFECDIIIRNEARMFVGLKYDKTISTAPVIILQGDERLNSQLHEIEEQHELYYFDNRPLTRELYEKFNEGDIIPDIYYKCIADIYSCLPRYKK